ncbi:hypothetical protein ACROYT_G013537 [Oculina patagonica]
MDNMAGNPAQQFMCSYCYLFADSLTALLEHYCPANVDLVEETQQNQTQQVVLPGEADGHPNLLQKWEDKYILLLIEKYIKSKHLLKKPRVTKKEVFETIAKQFNEEADVLVDGTQCMRKWSKLETQFKKIEDNNKQTGRANKSWKFYNHLEQCIGDSPRVHPAYTFDTAMPSTSSASSSTDSEKSSVVHSDSNGTDDDECDVDDSMAKGKKPKTLKKRQRKRKSHSSASEMLAFLESYTAKREKVEEEKLQLMRETQQKKDNFFTQFLDILKNK